MSSFDLLLDTDDVPLILEALNLLHERACEKADDAKAQEIRELAACIEVNTPPL